MSTPNQETTRAATDVAEIVTELDGGQFERQLSVALSVVAAKVVDFDKKGKVTIELDIEKITGTFQVRVGHKLKFTRPTGTGKASEYMHTIAYQADDARVGAALPDRVEHLPAREPVQAAWPPGRRAAVARHGRTGRRWRRSAADFAGDAGGAGCGCRKAVRFSSEGLGGR